MQHLKDYSRTVGTEPVEIHGSLYPLQAGGTLESTGGLTHYRVWNVSNTTIWLSRSGKAAKGAAGSFPLRPGEREEFSDPTIPLEALSAVAEAEGAGLTVELRHRPRVFTTGSP